jgi:hypothetical protein
MTEDTDTGASLLQDPPSDRFKARSVTGSCYTLVDETDRHGEHHYRTAYSDLPVTANDDGSFTILTTHTRLVRVGGV